MRRAIVLNNSATGTRRRTFERSDDEEGRKEGGRKEGANLMNQRIDRDELQSLDLKKEIVTFRFNCYGTQHDEELTPRITCCIMYIMSRTHCSMPFTRIRVLATIILVALCLSSTVAVQFELSSGQERCLSEDANVGDLVVTEFTIRPVSAVAFVTLTDPIGNAIYSKDASVNSNEDRIKFAYTSSQLGEYRICFYNRGTTLQQTIDLQFRLGKGTSADDIATTSVGNNNGDSLAKKDALKPMELKLKQLESTVQQIHSELKAYSLKEIQMKQANGKLT